MKNEPRILILEDVPEDAELIKRMLSKSKLQFTARTVDNKRDLLEELKEFQPDLILSDYSMPGFTGLEALEMVKEVAPSTPFIIVTGSISEETAVECMKAGAVDYVLKDRLKRIGPAVEAALENKHIRDENERVEKALAASAREWKTTFDAINDAVCLLDMNGNVLRCNTAMKNLVGKPFCEIIGKGCSVLFRNAASPDELCLFVRMHESRRRETTQVQLNDRWFDILVDPILDETGALIGGVQIVSDITKRKQAEAELRESEGIFRQFMDHSPIYVFFKDQNIRSTRLSRNYETMLGRPISELLGKNMDDLFPSYLAKSMIADDMRILKEGKQVECEEELNGRYYSTIKFPIDVEGKPRCLAGFTIDITERKRAEEERIRLVTAIEHAADIVVITDVDGTIQYVNPAFEKITGYGSEEAIGQNPRILKSGKHDEAFYKTMWDTILSGKVWKGNLTNKKKDGTFYEERATISPVKDKDGTITNFAAVKRDVTDEVIMEQRLLQAQKIEAIGTLAGGIAHDFNNILSAIIGYTELSLDTVPEDSQLHSDLTKIFKAGYRARDLVNQILTFSRRREQEKRPILITPIIKESLKLLRASLPSTIEIHQNIEPEPGTVLADPTQIHQVIMNLCTNAGHAMSEKGGILEVALCSKELDSEFCLQHPGLTPGLYLKLMVRDTGQGIAPDILPRIFEPYFTTKDKSGGTGLGLSMVHGIVTGYGGAVSVYSEPGKGTTFKVYLPLTTEEPVAEVEKTKPASKGHERILLVDDEQNIVDVGKRILEQLGYTVTTNSSSMDALELFQKDPYRFDLVISDMTMPFMTGDELAEEFMRIRQDIPIVICTGYSEKLTKEKALSIGIRAYLGKPLIKSEIAETVRRVLDQKSEDT